MSDELAASTGRFRELKGAPQKLLRALLITSTLLGSLWALEVHNYFQVTFFKQQYLALFLAFSFTQIHDSPAPATVWPRLIADLVCSQLFLVLVTPWFFALQAGALPTSGRRGLVK